MSVVSPIADKRSGVWFGREVPIGDIRALCEETPAITWKVTPEVPRAEATLKGQTKRVETRHLFVCA